MQPPLRVIIHVDAYRDKGQIVTHHDLRGHRVLKNTPMPNSPRCLLNDLLFCRQSSVLTESLRVRRVTLVVSVQTRTQVPLTFIIGRD
jgi:hypothetical protein